MRFQKAIKNREKLYSGVDPRIKRRVTNLAHEHDCSKSFVMNTILGYYLKIPLEEHFYDYTKTKRKPA